MVAGVQAPLRKRASIKEVAIIGLYLAKNVFQANGTGTDGSVVFRPKLSRVPSSFSSHGRARPTVAAQAQAVLVADMGQEHHVAPLAMRRGPVLPGMRPALRNAHQATQMAAGQVAVILGNMLKFHGF
jgi:hypothetical protein